MKRFLMIGLAALLVLAGGAVALASIPGPDGTIHGCYKTSNPAQGALIAIDSAASCPSGYTALNWSQTGPQGPAGTNGVSGLQIVSNGVYVNGGGGLTDVTVQCPTGKVAIAGAFGMNDTNTQVHASLPQQAVNNPGWLIEVRNNNAFAVPVTVQAICVIAS